MRRIFMGKWFPQGNKFGLPSFLDFVGGGGNGPEGNGSGPSTTIAAWLVEEGETVGVFITEEGDALKPEDGYWKLES